MYASQTDSSKKQIVGQPAIPSESALLDVEQVASLLRCSTRHVYRLADVGRMPRSIKLGSLVRWRRGEVLDWIAAGCPKVRAVKGGAR